MTKSHHFLYFISMAILIVLGGCYAWKPIPSTHLKMFLTDKTIVYMDGDSTGSIWTLGDVRIVGDSLYGLVVEKSRSMPLSEMESLMKMGVESILVSPGFSPSKTGENSIAISLNDVKNIQVYKEDKASMAAGVIVGVLLGVGMTFLIVFGSILG